MTAPVRSTSARTPRIAPGSRRDVGVLALVVAWVSGKVAGTSSPNLFLTLGRNRRLFRGWLRFAGALMPRGRLPRRETELVILRVAHRRGCSYEFEHHRHLGASAGLAAAEVEATTEPDPSTAGGWSPRDRRLLVAVDQLLDARDVTDETWRGLSSELNEQQLIELVMLVGHYDMLATTISTLRIQPDCRRG